MVASLTREAVALLERACARPVPPGGMTPCIGSLADEYAALRRQVGPELESILVQPAGWAAVAIDDGMQYGAAEPVARSVSHEQPGWRLIGRATGLGDGTPPRC